MYPVELELPRAAMHMMPLDLSLFNEGAVSKLGTESLATIIVYYLKLTESRACICLVN